MKVQVGPPDPWSCVGTGVPGCRPAPRALRRGLLAPNGAAVRAITAARPRVRRRTETSPPPPPCRFAGADIAIPLRARACAGGSSLLPCPQQACTKTFAPATVAVAAAEPAVARRPQGPRQAGRVPRGCPPCASGLVANRHLSKIDSWHKSTLCANRLFTRIDSLRESPLGTNRFQARIASRHDSLLDANRWWPPGTRPHVAGRGRAAAPPRLSRSSSRSRRRAPQARPACAAGRSSGTSA